MAGVFTPKDDVRCQHYAKFAANLWRWQFDILYWFLFSFNLFVLFCASLVYVKYAPPLPPKAPPPLSRGFHHLLPP